MRTLRLQSLSACLATLLLATTACARYSPSSAELRGRALPLNVAGASDLQLALPDIVERFQRGSPSQKVVLTFGSSGQLAEQIKAGAPFDVFLSANTAFVNELATDGHIHAVTVRPYAIGKLVIVFGFEQMGKVARLEDLAKPEVAKVAIANPRHAPYGMAAKQALERAGLWEVVSPKIVPADTVSQAMQFVQSGNAEVGLVSKAVASAPEIRSMDVDPALHDPLVQSLGIASRSKVTRAAESFALFVTGEAGRAVLRSHGFDLPPLSNTP